jgi:TPR repeat protein
MKFLGVITYFFILFSASFSDTLFEKELKARYITNDVSGMISLLEKDSGDPLSLFYNGYFWLDGVFGSVNPKLANYYFLSSINNARVKKDNRTLAISLKNLGDSFYAGDGIEEITLRALDCYEESAKLGYAPAVFNAAVVYNELGNIKKSRYWLKKYCRMKDADLKEYAQKLLKDWETNFKAKKNVNED